MALEPRRRLPLRRLGPRRSRIRKWSTHCLRSDPKISESVLFLFHFEIRNLFSPSQTQILNIFLSHKTIYLGQNVQPKRDLTRFVKWPKYIRLQRQKAILLKRLKVPPSINQFSSTLDRQSGAFFFLHHSNEVSRKLKL